MNRIRKRGLAASFLWFTGATLFSACDLRPDDRPLLPPTRSLTLSSTSPAPAASPGSSSMPQRLELAQANPPRPAPSPGTMGGKAISADDVDFVSKAASAGALEVEAGRVALEKTKAPSVRNFAQKMVEEHSKTAAELRALSVASSVANVAVLSPKEGEQLRRLKELQGREFDREYVAQIGVATHRQAVGAFEKAAGTATDSQVKTFAQAKLPSLRENLKAAQVLAKEVGAPEAGTKDDPLATGAAK